jgi:drug/metabolite transporter (DMT)-like permease
VVSKDLMSYMGPFELTFFRFFIGLIGLVIYSAYTGAYKQIKDLRYQDYSLYALLGFINIFFSMTMLQFAIKYGEPAVVALIISSNPIFVYILSIARKHEAVSLRRSAGFVIGILGIASVVIRDFNSFNLEKGSLFALAGAVSFAFFTIINKRAVRNHSPLIVNTFSFAFGTTFIALYVLISGTLNISPDLFESNIRIIKLLYLGIFVTAISYITFLTAIKKMGPVASSLVFLFKPSVATIFAVIFLSEEIRMNLFVGLLLSSIGSYLIIKKKNLRGIV